MNRNLKKFFNDTDHLDLAVMASQQKQNQGQSSEKQPEPELQGILFSILNFKNIPRQIFLQIWSPAF